MIIFEKDRDYDKRSVGGKGYGLFRLARYGLRVPDFFVIEVGTDLKSEDFLRELDAAVNRLGGDLFAVRSSGTSEDGEEISFAGQYLTQLNVRKDDVLQAVYNVCASVNDQNARAYAKKFSLSCEMAIVVQKQIESREAGVLFSTSPQDSNEILIERVSGCGESLVSGKVIPQTLRYSKTDIAEGYLGELLNAARTLEEGEGGAVDVEWAYDGKLHFLQLRRQTVSFDVIPPIPERNWRQTTSHDFTIWNHSVQARASMRDIQEEMFGFSLPISESLLVCGREFYSDENDAAADEVWKEHDKGNFFSAFLSKIKTVEERTMRRTSVMRRKTYSQYSNRALLSAYERETQAYTESYVPMMMRPDEYLYGQLKALAGDHAEEWVNALKALLPPTFYGCERVSFLRAVLSGGMRRYISQYEWKNNPLGKTLMPVTEQEFLKRAEGMSSDQAKLQLQLLQKRKRAQAAVSRKLLASVRGEKRRLIELLYWFTYYRTRTAELSDRYFYYIRKNLLSEIARRFGLTDETLLLYRTDEVVSLFEGKRLSEGELKKRKCGEAIFFFNGGYETYFGTTAYRLLKELTPVQEPNGTLVGDIACAGEARGTVRVINDFTDTEKMEAGCILVTAMTTPDLVLALDKAVGIITDEGGITCHAAIIAREYGIPCLVGTRVATQLLRDGMTVELDCINGCVRISEE